MCVSVAFLSVQRMSCQPANDKISVNSRHGNWQILCAMELSIPKSAIGRREVTMVWSCVQEGGATKEWQCPNWSYKHCALRRGGHGQRRNGSGFCSNCPRADKQFKNRVTWTYKRWEEHLVVVSFRLVLFGITINLDWEKKQFKKETRQCAEFRLRWDRCLILKLMSIVKKSEYFAKKQSFIYGDCNTSMALKWKM
jgi:hypothetical protein